MPCRKEDYIFLEQSVRGDSRDVDALVTKIGEALQLHSNSGQKTVSVSVSCLHARTGTGKPEAGGGGGGAGGAAGAPVQRRHGCCMRLRTHRASPYRVPGGPGDPDWDQFRPWNKKKRREEEEEDPHRMLQDLILSGNLIKEAVRRLQVPEAADGVQS